MEQSNMIKEIVDFVKHHHESTASVSVYRRILGVHPGETNRDIIYNLQKGLEDAEPDEIESCYYIIK